MAIEKRDSPVNGLIFNPSTRIFYTVCSVRSFTEAANKLGITQSAVSQCIANLEKQLKFQLFDRTTRPLGLTPEAQLLRDQLINQVSEMSMVLDTIRTKNFIQTSISIGLIESIGRTVGPEIISSLVNRGRRVDLRSGNSDFLYQELLKDRVDCVVASGPVPDAENLESKLLFSEPHVIMLPAKLAETRKEWSWENLRLCGLPMVRYSRNTGNGELGEKVLRRANLNLPKYYSVDDNQIVFALVAARMGWCLTTSLTALLAPTKQEMIRLFPAPAPCEARKVYVVRKRETPGIFSDELAEICKAAIIRGAIPRIHEMMPWATKDISFDELENKSLLSKISSGKITHASQRLTTRR